MLPMTAYILSEDFTFFRNFISLIFPDTVIVTPTTVLQIFPLLLNDKMSTLVLYFVVLMQLLLHQRCCFGL